MLLYGNLLTGKGLKNKIPGRGVKRTGEGTIRASQDFMLSHHLTNFEMKNIFKTYLNLMLFIQQTVYLK